MEDKKFALDSYVVPLSTISSCMTVPHCVGGIFTGTFFKLSYVHLKMKCTGTV